MSSTTFYDSITIRDRKLGRRCCHICKFPKSFGDVGCRRHTKHKKWMFPPCLILQQCRARGYSHSFNIGSFAVIVIQMFIMLVFVDLLYALTLALIRTYKFCELGLLKLFTRQLRSILLSKCEKLGIVCHLPEQSRNKFSKEEEKRILKKCGYSTLVHVKINNVGVFPLIANRGSLAVGEEYMNGGWEVMGTDADVSEVFYRILVNNLFEWYFHPLNRFLYYLEFKAFNLQTRGRAFQIAEKHYDLGNDFFESFLDPWMQYSSAYWANADNLNDAQLHKLELIAKKLDLKPGMRVLDVGCGWGTLCKYLAENYGVECVGISVSKEGIKYAKKKCDGLKVELRVQDYRDLNEKFDRIVSIECLFHLGRHNHGTFFKTMNKCLKDDGILLLQVIGTNHKNMLQSDPFTHKYTFPNTYFPYYRELTKKTEGLFIIEDWHSFGLDFVRTLDVWQERFQQNWDSIKEQYDDRFYKLWNYNLSYGSAAFKSRKVQLWQIVFSKDGLKREYRAAR